MRNTHTHICVYMDSVHVAHGGSTSEEFLESSQKLRESYKGPVRKFKEDGPLECGV